MRSWIGSERRIFFASATLPAVTTRHLMSWLITSSITSRRAGSSSTTSTRGSWVFEASLIAADGIFLPLLGLWHGHLARVVDSYDGMGGPPMFLLQRHRRAVHATNYHATQSTECD